MFYVYLLKHTQNDDTYVGYTSDLKKRLEEHNASINTSTVRKSGKWEVIYYEAYSSQTDAQGRERKLKQHGSGKHELFKRIKNSLLPKTGAG